MQAKPLPIFTPGLVWLRRLAPIDRFRRLDERFFEPHGMKLLAPIGDIALDEDVLHANVERIHAELFGDLVQLLFAGPCALRNAVAAIRTGDGFVGVNRIAVDFDMRNSIRSRRRQAAADANRRAFFGVGAGAPVNRHFAGHQGAVFFHAGF